MLAPCRNFCKASGASNAFRVALSLEAPQGPPVQHSSFQAALQTGLWHPSPGCRNTARVSNM
eukprot:14671255-Alexandrium_andersonii.AAC.1